MKTKKLKFLAHESKDKVSGLLWLPSKPKAVVVLGHGAGAGMNHANMESIATELANIGVGTFRYQFPFMERGGGRDSETVSIATVCAAIGQAKSLVGRVPLFAGGHSFGGRMSSLAAAQTDFPKPVKGLIYFAFPLHAPNKPSDHRAEHLKNIKVPMLFLSGTRDALASLDLFQPVIKRLGRKAKLHLLDTANHGYKILKRTRKSEEDVFVEMARVAEDWIGKKV
jgi:predicted alpha/beta-hydrolase family hydrolase